MPKMSKLLDYSSVYHLTFRCLCSLTLDPYPQLLTLGSDLVGLRPPKYYKNKFTNKAYYLLD